MRIDVRITRRQNLDLQSGGHESPSLCKCFLDPAQDDRSYDQAGVMPASELNPVSEASNCERAKRAPLVERSKPPPPGSLPLGSPGPAAEPRAGRRAAWGLSGICRGEVPSISGATTACFGRCGSPHCWIWTLWESTLLDLDALGVQISGSGRSGSPDCWIWTLWESRLLDLDALGVFQLLPRMWMRLPVQRDVAREWVRVHDRPSFYRRGQGR